MSRKTLLVIISLLQDTKNEIAKSQIQVFKHFYKAYITEIPEPIPVENFSSVLYDPTLEDLLISLHPDVLVFILYIPDKVAYIGVSRDVFSREYSIELPSRFNWEQLIECAKQTSQSLISFNPKHIVLKV